MTGAALVVELAAIVWLVCALGRRQLGWRLVPTWMLVVPGIPLVGALTYVFGPVLGVVALGLGVILLVDRKRRTASRA
ncbi:MAG: DUF2484 family protein [Gemmobacter sp.]|nr:DUF2484 family protein [Gemmobacter sp.]